MLLSLARRPGQVVTKRELLDEVWGDVAVGEAVLTNAVWQLRRAFGGRGSVIETIPTTGYRLASSVLFEDPLDDPGRSVAVLPFEESESCERTADPWFALALSGSIGEELARLPGLRVIGTDSTCRYPDGKRHARRIGGDLGVGNLVRGTLRRERERAHLSVRLVDTRDERLLWVRSYERPLAELPRLPREVAGQIALQLGASADRPAAKVGGASSVGTEAFDLFLRGCLRMRRPAFADIEDGLADLRRAVELSNDFPQAHAAVARGYYLLARWGRGPGTRLLPEAESAAERALALDPSLAEARVWSILARAISAWDVERARSELQGLLRIEPHHPAARDGLARCHAALGRVADAIAEQRRALAGDPLSPALGTTLGFFHRLAGEHDAALALLGRVRQLHPEWFIAALEVARVHWTRGDRGAASAALAVAEPTWAAFLADVAEGRRRQARDALDQWEQESRERYVAPYWMAEHCMWAGEQDRALEWLERAYEERQVQAIFVAVEPVFAPLRAASRFERLCRRMGLRAT